MTTEHSGPGPFSTVLIANRGEIARRIIRTLRRCGIRSVAVYSDADRDAPFVHEADEAVRIGLAPAAKSYLDIDAVIAAAIASGAEAIHPGYGFLSENVEFRHACDEAGIVFIGPGVRALTVMADKIRSKAHVSAHGVPVVPGFSAAGLSGAEIAELAETTGYPLLVKPSAGGGGKGMQIVDGPQHLDVALAAARRVARASFGDDTLLLERLVHRPRHIEVQVFADAYGGVISLGERECTLQRRHQKVIEEAPSPIVDADTRRRLGEAACQAAASVDYLGAGTVEFLVSADRPDEFFFIEMNTRLQVEHPVTELVTGLDLVELQLVVAAGGHLPMEQDDVVSNGHAIEARVYAEDPANGFLPQAGTVAFFRPAPGVRTDGAIETGTTITGDYDPMIAKVIAHAADRRAALRALDDALAETVIFGIETNIDFLRDLLADEAVQTGALDTGLIDRMRSTPRRSASPGALAAAAWAMRDRQAPIGAALRGAPRTGVWQDLVGFRLNGPAAAHDRVFADAGGRIHSVATAAPSTAGAVTCIAADGRIWVHDGGSTTVLTPLSRRAAQQQRASARAGVARAMSPEVRAPMPGTVVATFVADGDHVQSGQRLLAIEAMKMEHPIAAPHDGTVQLNVAVGEQVRKDQITVTVTPAAPDADAAFGTAGTTEEPA